MNAARRLARCQVFPMAYATYLANRYTREQIADSRQFNVDFTDSVDFHTHFFGSC
jgi:hypothetical protein